MYSAFRPTLPIWKPAQRTAPNTRRNVQRIGHAYFAPMRRYILVNNVHAFASPLEEKPISIIITESLLHPAWINRRIEETVIFSSFLILSFSGSFEKR